VLLAGQPGSATACFGTLFRLYKKSAAGGPWCDARVHAVQVRCQCCDRIGICHVRSDAHASVCLVNNRTVCASPPEPTATPLYNLATHILNYHRLFSCCLTFSLQLRPLGRPRLQEAKRGARFNHRQAPQLFACFAVFKSILTPEQDLGSGSVDYEAAAVRAGPEGRRRRLVVELMT
jgi:hypothetical protein